METKKWIIEYRIARVLDDGSRESCRTLYAACHEMLEQWAKSISGKNIAKRDVIEVRRMAFDLERREIARLAMQAMLSGTSPLLQDVELEDVERLIGVWSVRFADALLGALKQDTQKEE